MDDSNSEIKTGSGEKITTYEDLSNNEDYKYHCSQRESYSANRGTLRSNIEFGRDTNRLNLFSVTPFDVLYDSENEAAASYNDDSSQSGQQQSAPTVNLDTSNLYPNDSNVTQEEIYLKIGSSQNEEEPVVNDNDAMEKSKSEESYKPDGEIKLQDRGLEQGGGGRFSRRREVDNNGSWLGIQRQLLQLERQQAHIMNMLQDIKDGSRDGMVTLEKRVWGLERVVKDMAHNLSLSMDNLKTSCYMNAFEESSGRSLSKYNGFSDYRSRGSSWNHQSHTQNTKIGLRKGGGPVRFGEGPSARSVWKASKNEATLQAIRGVAPEVAGTENLVKNRDPGLAV